MAMTNKTTLNIKMTDTNLKSKTFNVGYVNPESSDGTLREFGAQIASLTDMSLNEVYRTNVEDITNASTDTSISGFPLLTNSQLLTTNSQTYRTKIKELLPSDDAYYFGDIQLSFSYSSGGSTITLRRSIDIPVFYNASSFQDVIDAFNAVLYQNGQKISSLSIPSTGSISFEDVDDKYSSIIINSEVDNEFTEAVINEIGDNLKEAPQGFTYNVSRDQTTNKVKLIYINKQN